MMRPWPFHSFIIWTGYQRRYVSHKYATEYLSSTLERTHSTPQRYSNSSLLGLRWYGSKTPKNMNGNSSKGKKSSSSTRWLQRQQNDPMVKLAQLKGYRSRASFKLLEINQKFQVLKRDDLVVDLGAAPGGWTQVAVELTQRSSISATNRSKIVKMPLPTEDSSKPNVLAIDLRSFDDVYGAISLVGDFRTVATQEQIEIFLQDRDRENVDVVLSDMAPSFTGNFLVDGQAQLTLCANAFLFCTFFLKHGGHFVVKVLRNEDVDTFRDELKSCFEQVKMMKPKTSRNESTEAYLIAKGYRRKKNPLLPRNDGEAV